MSMKPPLPSEPSPFKVTVSEQEWRPHVPVPMLTQVDNPSIFTLKIFDRMGPRRAFYDVIVLKGRFDLSADGLRPSAKRAELVWSDESWDNDNAEISSLKASADLELYKPSTDILVTGTVKSFERKPQKEWSGMLRAWRRENGKDTTLIQKTLRFTGPRWWKSKLLGGWSLSDPEKAIAVPLRYELAYGGHWIDPKQTDTELAREVYLQNPSGSGYFGKSHDPNKDYPGPQIELQSKAISASNHDYVPAGFGPIARFWAPRAQWAGTHDAAWEKQFHESLVANELPDYAADFDYRHFQAAPADQITPSFLIGGDWIGIAGVFEDTQGMIFQLPKFRIDSDLRTSSGKIKHAPMNLDTVLINLDTRSVELTWRLTLPQKACIKHATLKLTDLTPSTKEKK